VMSLDYHYGMHIMGTSWGAASDNPENSDLETGSNWSLAYQTPKLVPIVRMEVNTPIAGTPYS